MDNENWVEVNGIPRLVPNNSPEWEECADCVEGMENEPENDDYGDLEYFEF